MLAARSRCAQLPLVLRFQSSKRVPEATYANLLQFSPEKTGDFVLSAPQLANPFITDEFLMDYVHLHCPASSLKEVLKDLERFGDRIVSEVDALGIECEQNPPKLERTDAWGKRVDHIWTTPAWKEQHKVSAEEGLIAIGYEQRSGSFSRVHQMIKNIMYGPSSGLYNCPLAMTDGAALISKSEKSNHAFLSRAHDHLTSRDPEKFWTSGQWMTEKRGGSDVGSATDTHAVFDPETGDYRLYGYKWFTSAITSDMTLTLARCNDYDGQIEPGSRGLSMFFLELRDENGNLNNIQVHKLKNKLGTKQLPTAELNLCGSEAKLVGEEGKGIKLISGMLTITRIHNAIAACSFMRRINHMARDYAMKRSAFGASLDQQAAHVQVLARLEIESRAAMLLSLKVAGLLGRIELSEASSDETDLMRILTPLAKLVTGKQTVAVCSEGLECFGGQGYIEDTHLPKLLRDSQVLPIWEGTSTVMSLDVLRSIQKSKGTVLMALIRSMQQILKSAIVIPELEESIRNVSNNLVNMTTFVEKSNAEKIDFHLKSARDFSFSIGRSYQAALLIEHAVNTRKHTDIYAANHYSKSSLVELDFDYSKQSAKNEYDLVFANYQT